MEKAYTECGWRIKMFTDTAVSDRYGTTEFFSDNDFKHLEWGGSILGPKIMTPIRKGMGSKAKMRQVPLGDKNDTKTPNERAKRLVNLIRLSDFIHHVVATRKIPNLESFEKEFKPPTVIMKLDIEGSEVDVVSDLLFSGSLKHLNIAMIEWHQDLMEDASFRKRATLVSNAIILNFFYPSLIRCILCLQIL